MQTRNMTQVGGARKLSNVIKLARAARAFGFGRTTRREGGGHGAHRRNAELLGTHWPGSMPGHWANR